MGLKSFNLCTGTVVSVKLNVNSKIFLQFRRVRIKQLNKFVNHNRMACCISNQLFLAVYCAFHKHANSKVQRLP